MKQELSKRLQFMVAIPVLVALIIIGLPLAGCVYVLWWLYGMTIHVLVWGCWCMRGIHVIVVYSDSPVWHDYIDEKMIPRLPENTIILNWSERRTWQWYPLRVQVFHYFGGKRHFNPLVLVFHPLRRTGTFRFWQAFRDYKHGNSQPLHEMEQRMFKAVAKTGHIARQTVSTVKTAIRDAATSHLRYPVNGPAVITRPPCRPGPGPISI